MHGCFGDADGIAGYSSTTGALGIDYYSNDMVQSQTQGAGALTFALDPAQNRINTQTDGTTLTTNHYDDPSDRPA